MVWGASRRIEIYHSRGQLSKKSPAFETGTCIPDIIGSAIIVSLLTSHFQAIHDTLVPGYSTIDFALRISLCDCQTLDPHELLRLTTKQSALSLFRYLSRHALSAHLEVRSQCCPDLSGSTSLPYCCLQSQGTYAVRLKRSPPCPHSKTLKSLYSHSKSATL